MISARFRRRDTHCSTGEPSLFAGSAQFGLQSEQENELALATFQSAARQAAAVIAAVAQRSPNEHGHNWRIECDIGSTGRVGQHTRHAGRLDSPMIGPRVSRYSSGSLNVYPHRVHAQPIPPTVKGFSPMCKACTQEGGVTNGQRKTD